MSQLLSNKGQDIYIGSGVEMTINGSVLNEGTLENNGEIILMGDWENKQQYIPGKGAIILSGGAQKIDHAGGTIYELVIDRGEEKTFLSDASVAGRLELIEGFVTPLKGVKLIAKSTATVTDGYTKSYINGAFYHEGNGKKVFPIGKNGHYNPVILEISDGQPTLGIEVFEPNVNPYFTLELEEVSQEKFWKQTLLSGKIGEGALITLPMDIQSANATEEEIVVAAASSEDGNYKPLTTFGYTGFINNGSITGKLPANAEMFAIGVLAASPEERSIYIPNAFAPMSPKANMEDNRIKVYGREISPDDFLFRIYNRWGIMVYETTSLDQASTRGWDGINRQTGESEIMGSYKYILKGKFNSGKSIERSGTIHLIR